MDLQNISTTASWIDIISNSILVFVMWARRGRILYEVIILKSCKMLFTGAKNTLMSIWITGLNNQYLLNDLIIFNV